MESPFFLKLVNSRGLVRNSRSSTPRAWNASCSSSSSTTISWRASPRKGTTPRTLADRLLVDRSSWSRTPLQTSPLYIWITRWPRSSIRIFIMDRTSLTPKKLIPFAYLFYWKTLTVPHLALYRSRLSRANTSLVLTQKKKTLRTLGDPSTPYG